MTVKDRTTIVVDAPFIGICGAVHMEELMQSVGDADPLGLRERLLLMYEHPRFVRSTELREACDKLPAELTLHQFLAKTFWPLHCVHHPAHKRAQFTQDLNYTWLHYSFAPEAAELFWENFDDHAGQQESNYRLDQQAAKKAGKGKTRHFRLALPLHNLLQKANDVQPENWDCRVSADAARASVLFSTYMDNVFACLDLIRRKPLPAPPNAAEAPGPPAERRRPKSALEHRLVETLQADAATLLQEPGRQIVVTMARAVCTSQKAQCMRHSDVHHLKPVIALNLPTDTLALNSPSAFRLLQILGLGAASLSTNSTGVKCMFFAKLPEEMLQHDLVQKSITALQLPSPFSTAAAAVVRQHKKANQADIVFPDATNPEQAAKMAAAAELLR